jgi:23S rRNA (uracil1939-C5)-methyltransferase
VRVTIEKLVYGGAGLTRTNEGVVFVHRTAPGDVLEVELVDRKKDYATARILKLLEPSSDRQQPSCPNYQTAGCCHWQHVRYEKQVEYKESILRETLRRAGRIEWNSPIRTILGPDRNYRLRATFHIRDGKLGFVRERSNVIVPIRECAALVHELNAWIPEANQTLSSDLSEVHAIAGAMVVSSITPSTTRIDFGGYAYDVHPDAFFQSNRFLLEPFVNEVLEQAKPNGVYALDLYCGSGFFSIPIAKQAKEIIGVESHRTAIKQAKKNARLNEVRNTEFFEGQVDAALQDAQIHPDVVILNPPRTGVGKATAEKIASLQAARVVYVSCNPSTFAREAGVFLGKGYSLERVTLIDQFPNTYHIEMVAQFELK